jgi:hypothetical protein
MRWSKLSSLGAAKIPTHSSQLTSETLKILQAPLESHLEARASNSFFEQKTLPLGWWGQASGGNLTLDGFTKASRTMASSKNGIGLNAGLCSHFMRSAITGLATDKGILVLL